MKRYKPTGAVYEYEDLMCEGADGEYVLAAEAQAEIDRLRAALAAIGATEPGRHASDTGQGAYDCETCLEIKEVAKKAMGAE